LPDQSSDSSARAAAATATAVAVALIAQQVAGKATRDALFLSLYPASKLPLVMVVSSALSFLVVLYLGRAMTRLSPARVVPGVFLVSAALYLGEWVAIGRNQYLAAVAVYVHTAALGAAGVSAFWSVVNERFDPHTAKSVVARVAAGATAGGVVGGVAAWQALRFVELPTLLIGLGVVNLGCCVGIWRFGRGERARRRQTLKVSTGAGATGSMTSNAAAVIRQVPYLRHLALLIAFGTIAEAAVDYVFKARADARFENEAGQLIEFFALFYMATGIATFLLQTSLARRALRGFGLAGTVATLPGTVVAGGLIGMFVPGLWSVAGLRGAATVVENSLFRSGYELLYTPLPPEKKRPTKTFIDVGCDKLGGALGSGLAALAVALIPLFAERVLLSVAVAAAVASLMVASYLHRGYVAALADSLRSGKVRLDDGEVMDATTRRTLADTTMALDRDKLLREIDALREQRGGATGAGAAAADSAALAITLDAMPDELHVQDPVLVAAAELRTGDPERVRAVFRRFGELPPELVVYAISLLASNPVLGDVVSILRKNVDRHVGLLTDALINPSTDFAVRRRIPRVLRSGATQRAADALLAGLEDERFEVRYRCGISLYKLLEDHPGLEVDRARVLEAARREARVGKRVWNSQRVVDSEPDDEAAPFAAERTQRTVGRSLEHVFTILSTVLDREPLQLAFRALATDDDSLRGTGLEYLDNVIPPDILRSLSPFLDDRTVARKATRPRQKILDELLTSMDSTGLDVEALRRSLDKNET